MAIKDVHGNGFLVCFPLHPAGLLLSLSLFIFLFLFLLLSSHSPSNQVLSLFYIGS